ncbi:hypothetical protein [Nocardioides sp.]|uniref:hypothetical protein n=1 Tax=Nocardioides sp. TaxID=35761 RepID=UPI00260E178C|nr:hypothetical protein [Nocardioides sp.]
MNKPRVVLPGVLIGVVALALAVVFGVLLPKAHGDTGNLSLPDKLPGGYVAADLRSAYDSISSATDAQKASYATQQVNAKKYADTSFKSMGISAVARNYLTKDGQGFIAVQLIRAEGGALSPYLFTDPAQAQSGSSLDHFVKAGDATCIETGTANGTSKLTQSMIECQKSEHGLTLQVTTQGEVATVGKLIDSIWAEVA